jgi:hypothetical protein
MASAALFIGANESVCVSTTVHPELKAGHVYCTEDDLTHKGRTRCDDDRHVVRVFCLKDDTEPRRRMSRGSCSTGAGLRQRGSRLASHDTDDGHLHLVHANR